MKVNFGSRWGAFGIHAGSQNASKQNNVFLNASGSEIPSSAFISSVFPNPFNPTTNIEFELLFGSDENISVYDINGSLVDEIVSDYMNSGVYNFIWDASNYSSGVYFMQVKTNFGIQTSKLMLLK